MTSFFNPCISVGIFITADLLPRVIDAAVASLIAAAAPEVTNAPSQRRRLARYSPAAVCSCIRCTWLLGATAMAAWTSCGVVGGDAKVEVLARLIKGVRSVIRE